MTNEELQAKLNGLTQRLGVAILNRENFESEERQVRTEIQALLAQAQQQSPSAVPSSSPKTRRKNITPREVAEVHRLHAEGFSKDEIAERVGRSYRTVWHALRDVPKSPPWEEKLKREAYLQMSSHGLYKGEAPSSKVPTSGPMDTWSPAQSLLERTPDVRDQASASTAGPVWPSDRLDPL